MNRNKFFIETFGCQMNFSDSEIVASLLKNINLQAVNDAKQADIILINTCAIRDNAEQRVFKRLNELKSLKKKRKDIIIGVLGCMAERMKELLLEKSEIIDLIIGPDAYRNLPEIIKTYNYQTKAIDTILSESETYDNIEPYRIDSNGVSAFISIMRGCENFCSYCVVPYTRGKERSRNPQSIIQEAQQLFENGYKEITLLGQNVNSYYWKENDKITNFASLIHQVAQIHPKLRIRFATSHPKDISEELIRIIASHPNICKSIHLPVQSGSTRILQLMNRRYSRENYLKKIAMIKQIIPECSLSTDIICGFCDETDEDHQQTLSLMEQVGYDFAYMFKYSEREGTDAANKYADNIPETLKIKRLNEVIALQQQLSLTSNKKDIGKTMEVLIEGISKRSEAHVFGRNSQNKVVVLPKNSFKPGDYANVKIKSCTAATLIAE